MMKLKYAMKLEYAVKVGSGRQVVFVLTVPVGYEAFESAEQANKYIPQYGSRFEARLINLLLCNGREACFISLYDTLNDCIVDTVHWDEHLKYSSVITKKEAAGRYSRVSDDYEPSKMTFSNTFKLHAQNKNTHVICMEYLSSYIVPVLVQDETNQIVKELVPKHKHEMDAETIITEYYKLFNACRELESVQKQSEFAIA